jgi:threonine synthase
LYNYNNKTKGYEMTKAEIANNKVIMNFLLKEAMEKTAEDIRAKQNSGTTAKAIEMLIANGNQEVIERVREYVRLGMEAVSQIEIKATAK